MATLKQHILRLLYPLIRKIGQSGKNGTILINENNINPQSSFYEQKAVLPNGKEISFSDFKGKKVLIVNTASNCGYTGQYAELQTLHEKMGADLVIIAFPSNDFAEQEKASDKEIERFCQINYGVSFPIAKKDVVVKNDAQQPVFRWLSDITDNGWNDHAPDWNFGKYLINGNGSLTAYFGPSVSPLDNIFLNTINQ